MSAVPQPQTHPASSLVISTPAQFNHLVYPGSSYPAVREIVVQRLPLDWEGIARLLKRCPNVSRLAITPFNVTETPRAPPEFRQIRSLGLVTLTVDASAGHQTAAALWALPYVKSIKAIDITVGQYTGSRNENTLVTMLLHFILTSLSGLLSGLEVAEIRFANGRLELLAAYAPRGEAPSAWRRTIQLYDPQNVHPALARGLTQLAHQRISAVLQADLLSETPQENGPLCVIEKRLQIPISLIPFLRAPVDDMKGYFVGLEELAITWDVVTAIAPSDVNFSLPVFTFTTPSVIRLVSDRGQLIMSIQELLAPFSNWHVEDAVYAYAFPIEAMLVLQNIRPSSSADLQGLISLFSKGVSLE